MFQYKISGTRAQISSLATAQPITVPAGSQGVLIQAITQNVRMSFDGSTPTATNGWQIKAGDPPAFYPFEPGTVLLVIQETATAEVQWVGASMNQVGAALRTG